jgi:NhaP-type Na+/H+ or K+/H+ antiporter
LLKSVGAAPKMTMLIVGESLLNDGSAIVLFTIFFEALKGTRYTAQEVIGFTLAAVFGSVLFGIVCGLFTVWWLRTANRPLKETDVTMQIGITICCAYLTFFIAQNLCEISGVLACCSAGAMLAWLGPPIILNHESMHNVWGMAEWALNTLIFLLAGLIIGHRVLQKVSRLDWLLVVVLYFVLMLVRSVTLIVLFPFLSRIGHGCTRNEAVFMSWTGLRGAVGMALALIVEKTGPDDLDDEVSRLFFYVGGIATLSLLINGTTAKPLLFRLGLLTSDSAEKLLVTNQIKKKLQKKMDKVVSQMTKEFSFTEDDLEQVRLSCTLLHQINMDALYRDTERMSTLLADAVHEEHRPGALGVDSPRNNRTISEHIRSHSTSMNRRSRVLSMGLSASAMAMHNNTLKLQRMSRLLSTSHRGGNNLIEAELVNYIRSIFLEIVRVKYWHFIEVGKLPRLSFSAQYLLYSVEVALDDVSNDSNKRQSDSTYSRDWTCIDEQLRAPTPIINLLLFLERHLPVSCGQFLTTNPLTFLETRKEKREVYMLTSFIEAHEHAQSKIHKFLDLESDEMEDGARPDDENAMSVQTPEEKLVIEESKRSVIQYECIYCSLFFS